MPQSSRKPSTHGLSPWQLLLLLPFLALLYVPFYNCSDPVILGFPFFYAYQIAWVLITAILTGLVYWLAD